MKRFSSLLKRDWQETGARRRTRRPSNLAFNADHSASPGNSILQSLLTLYGLMALMLGVVIPISDALAKPVEHAVYRQMFYIFMHGVGIGCIVYLNTLISCYQHHRAGDFAVDNPDDSRTDRPTVCFTLEPVPGPSATADDGRSLFSVPDVRDGDSELPDGHSRSATLCARNGGGGGGRDSPPPAAADAVQIELATQTTEASIYEDSGPQRADDVPFSSPKLKVELSGPAAGGYSRRRRRRVSSHRKLVSSVHKQLSRTWRSPVMQHDGTLKFPVKKITWSAVGVNLYLRLGAIVFGFGVMVHDGFKIADVLERPGSEACVGPWFLPKHCIHLLFIMCQTYYVFKHHRVTINTQRVLVRFVFMHLIVTNLCIWVKTVIYEIKVGLTHSHSGGGSSSQSPYNSSYTRDSAFMNGSDHSNATSDGCYMRYIEEDSPSYKLGPYLYPCAVEYGLICAAICHKFFSRVGDSEVVPYGKKEQPVGPRSTTCHKSHKGLFLGLIVMICVLVPVISLIFLQKVETSRYRDLYILAVILVECFVLCFTTGVALAGTVKAIRNLRLYKVRGNETFDVNLLFVGLAGIVCYNLFVAISAQYHATQANGFKSVLEVAQSVSQTLFIMQAIQRKVTMRLVARLHKPGRGVTIALLISNLAMWIASVFEAQRTIAENFLLSYFGEMPWNIIKYIFLPLIIFFRFHSTVCLSEIWIQSYKPPKRHHLQASHRGA